MSLSTGESYSTKSIAKFLGMNEIVVRDIIKNYLINCQTKYNKALEQQINLLNDSQQKLAREIKNDEN